MAEGAAEGAVAAGEHAVGVRLEPPGAGSLERAVAGIGFLDPAFVEDVSPPLQASFRQCQALGPWEVERRMELPNFPKPGTHVAHYHLVYLDGLALSPGQIPPLAVPGLGVVCGVAFGALLALAALLLITRSRSG